jgi:hypothetical protein
MKAAIEPSLFETVDRQVAERRLIQAETNLAAAKGSIDAMRRIWPEGEDIYDRFYLAISELSLRRQYVEDFVSIFSLEIGKSELNMRHQSIMAKNRETMMIAGTYLAEAADILHDQTEIKLKV